MDTVLPNIRRLQTACRSGGIEVMYSVIENMTRDGRDRSLDYKISGIDVPRGSWEAQVLDEIAPADDEMIFRKTSSSVFISTNIDYVLRNLGARSLIITGIMTDQCVESAVRDACDLGYLVTLVTDACTTTSAERHEQSLLGIRGYCRQRATDTLLTEIARAHPIALNQCCDPSEFQRRIECLYRRQWAVEPLDFDHGELSGAALRQFRCAGVARQRHSGCRARRSGCRRPGPRGRTRRRSRAGRRRGARPRSAPRRRGMLRVRCRGARCRRRRCLAPRRPADGCGPARGP